MMCNNCKTYGHLFGQCELPIVSFGIILFRWIKPENDNVAVPEYLMIRRRDSFGFAAFLRGKYEVQNIEYIQNLINEMSMDEKQRITRFSFEELWVQMCGGPISHKIEGQNAHKKFNILKNGVQINNEIVDLNKMVANSSSVWEETEWEFPKGRCNKNEKEIECAIREFEEETGYSKNKIAIVGNVVPYEETFIGSNHRSYKHKYFLAYATYNEKYGKHQQTEVSKVKWKKYDECLSSIRPHQLVKSRLITNVHRAVTQHFFFD